MKMMCVKTPRLQEPYHPLLHVGEIYDVVPFSCPSCGSGSIIVPGVRFKRAPWRAYCKHCKRREQFYDVPFPKTYFVPWNPEQLGVTEREVLELYTPQEPVHVR